MSIISQYSKLFIDWSYSYNMIPIAIDQDNSKLWEIPQIQHNSKKSNENISVDVDQMDIADYTSHDHLESCAEICEELVREWNSW